jgi:hypothetical protein
MAEGMLTTIDLPLFIERQTNCHDAAAQVKVS